jgi:hypothetical protein
MFGICEHPQCKSKSQCRPILRFQTKPSENGKRLNHEMDVQMEFCSSHQDYFKEVFIVNDASRSAIENHLKGHGHSPPDWDTLKIVWAAAAGSDGLDDEGRSMVKEFHGRKLGSHPMSAATDITADRAKHLMKDGSFPKDM